MHLVDRINKIINNPFLEMLLEAEGYGIIDLQLGLMIHKTFNALPKEMQRAIERTERLNFKCQRG